MDFSFNKISLWTEQALDAMMRNRRRVLMALAGVAVGCCLMVGYHYYNQWTQASAHKDFVEALRYYDAPVTSKTVATGDAIEFASDGEKWKAVEDIFKKGYNKHRNAGIGSMFCAYQAEALTRLGEIDEAITLLQKAIKDIPSIEIKDFYRLKLALMKCDSAQAVLQQEGLSELKKIAENSRNFANELGLYYLGAYFWNQHDYAQTKNYWQQYMVKYGLKDAKNQSGFAEFVKARLKLISADW